MVPLLSPPFLPPTPPLQPLPNPLCPWLLLHSSEDSCRRQVVSGGFFSLGLGSLSHRFFIMMDKGKRARVEEDDGSEQLDTELVLAIEKLQEVQDELEKVNEEASDKVLEVEQKYNEIRRPVYSKRNEIIQTIPDFWLTAFLSHPTLCELLSEEDQKVFKYLQSLDVEDFKDVKSGYNITFGMTNGALLEKDGNKRSFLSNISFFKWFSDTHSKDTPDGMHDEVAEIIKEDLWPNPLKYFNNEADDDEYEDEDDAQGKGVDGFDEEDELEDEDDDDDDDDS
eukprot:c24134_g1_i1 orf=87-929(+)